MLQKKECPICKSGVLILKNGKYGEFWGCSNFPNCKYSKSDYYYKNELPENCSGEWYEDLMYHQEF